MNRLVILEGASGSGKTTLMNILNNEGFNKIERNYLLDDTSGINDDEVTRSWWRAELQVSTLYNIPNASLVVDRSMLSYLYWSDDWYDRKSMTNELLEIWVENLSKWDRVDLVLFDRKIKTLWSNIKEKGNPKDLTKDDIDEELSYFKKIYKQLDKLLSSKSNVGNIHRVSVTNTMSDDVANFIKDNQVINHAL